MKTPSSCRSKKPGGRTGSRSLRSKGTLAHLSQRVQGRLRGPHCLARRRYTAGKGGGQQKGLLASRRWRYIWLVDRVRRTTMAFPDDRNPYAIMFEFLDISILISVLRIKSENCVLRFNRLSGNLWNICSIIYKTIGLSTLSLQC